MLERAATGGHINGATLVGVNAAGQQVYQLDLADVQATKVEDDAVAGLTLSLDYGKIELQTFTQNGTGGVVPDGQFGFDRIANTSNVMVPSALPSGSVASSPQPATYFMLIDGVNGGSTDAQHKGWFEITGVDLDVAHMRLPASGEANFSPLIVTPENEAGLAGVMDLAATGGLVKGVHIEGFTGGATPAEVYDLTLADVTVTKVADGEGDGYSLSLDYGKIALITNGIDATGQPTSNGAFAYDVVNNIEIDPFSLDLNPSGNHGARGECAEHQHGRGHRHGGDAVGLGCRRRQPHLHRGERSRARHVVGFRSEPHLYARSQLQRAGLRSPTWRTMARRTARWRASA